MEVKRKMKFDGERSELTEWERARARAASVE